MADTTNSLGKRALERYAAGTLDRATLDGYYAKGWISDADYAAATAEPEQPAGEATPAKAPAKKKA